MFARNVFGPDLPRKGLVLWANIAEVRRRQKRDWLLGLLLGLLILTVGSLVLFLVD
jgi:hypothetical protein